jgi:GT2 family glycosyltransferase
LSPLRVSIVVLNYNYAGFLPSSIGGACRQDWPHCEVIVVDDASNDESRAVIAAYGEQVRTVLQPENRGHGAGINAGFAVAWGDLVIFLDADDFLRPTAARRLVESYETDVALYQYRLDLVDSQGRAFDAYPLRERGWEDGDVRRLLLERGRFSTTVTSGLAFDRRVLEQILPMDETAFRQGGDGFLLATAPLYGRVKTIDETLGAYRQHGANHSQFAFVVAERARWRLEHDKMRYGALADHASRLGLPCAPDLWRRDAPHLEERMASLLLEPGEHAFPGDTRREIARHGLAACTTLPVAWARREVMRLWWRLLGWGPLSLARAAIVWKLQAAGRPAAVRVVARALRRATSMGAWVKAASVSGKLAAPSQQPRRQGYPYQDGNRQAQG